VKTADSFLRDVDRRWVKREDRIPLHIIGSVALLLRTDYDRGTKDSDVLQTKELTEVIKGRLLALAGRETELHRRHGMYMEVVPSGLPFLPHVPLYHALDELNASLQHFEIQVLDVVDVVVSKLKPFRGSDIDDIREMVERGLVPHEVLISRFKDAVDDYLGSAGAEDIPRFVKNLNRIERDLLQVQETEIGVLRQPEGHAPVKGLPLAADSSRH
jgi:Nucleotidyltransferase of unknown function (DUF6036)